MEELISTPRKEAFSDRLMSTISRALLIGKLSPASIHSLFVIPSPSSRLSGCSFEYIDSIHIAPSLCFD